MSPVRSKDIRESNEKLILRIIRKGEGISQSDVVSWTGLRAPTVLRFFNGLESDGFIRVTDRGPDRERRGRKPVYYEVIPEAVYALGMEFWAGSASIVMLDFAGNIVFSRTWLLESGDRSDIIMMLKHMFAESIKDSGISKERLLGLCVAAPGQVNIDTGEIVQYSRLGIDNINLKTELEGSLGLPVIVHNNAAAMAWDEYERGVGVDIGSLFIIMLRAGVGGAFIDNGEIFVTKTHSTLEIGHFSVEYNGRECDCGNRGCLETYLSEGVLLDDLAVVQLMDSIAEIDALLVENRPEVNRILDEKAGLLAQVIRNLISLFGPEMFLIVTRSSALGRYLAERVSIEVHHKVGRRWQGQTVIDSAVYDPEKAGRGAADLVYKNFFTK